MVITSQYPHHQNQQTRKQMNSQTTSKIWEIYSFTFLKETIKNYCSQIKYSWHTSRQRQSKHISADEIKDYMLNAKKSIRKMQCIRQ
jgi:hypothetical protein